MVENLRGATEEEEVEVVNRRELRKGLGELLLLLQKRLMEEDDEGEERGFREKNTIDD